MKRRSVAPPPSIVASSTFFVDAWIEHFSPSRSETDAKATVHSPLRRHTSRELLSSRKDTVTPRVKSTATLRCVVTETPPSPPLCAPLSLSCSSPALSSQSKNSVSEERIELTLWRYSSDSLARSSSPASGRNVSTRRATSLGDTVALAVVSTGTGGGGVSAPIECKIAARSSSWDECKLRRRPPIWVSSEVLTRPSSFTTWMVNITSASAHRTGRSPRYTSKALTVKILCCAVVHPMAAAASCAVVLK
mmetsp:Transcript_79275/g.155078  ORF Transcript_79275/g.155078 Transcript_79275/m.155078 type:complete len:249 (+) Transcript_79275:989-1735(+)